MGSRRAIFLDRDGTLNHDSGFVHRVADLTVMEHAAEGLRRMAELGYLLIIATNQSGIARGLFTEADMHAFNRALCALLAQAGAPITAVYFCPHHPTEGVGPYRQESPQRKPHPGMLLSAAADWDLDLAESFAIGDKLSDILAGSRAGCRTILVDTGMRGRELCGEPVLPDFKADNLVEAARYVESHCRSTRQPCTSSP